MYPQNFDSFQQQLNDLQRSYTQLGKTFPAQQQRPKREIHKEDGIDEALRELTKAQTDASLAAQSAYLLSVMGKWVANPSATVA